MLTWNQIPSAECYFVFSVFCFGLQTVTQRHHSNHTRMLVVVVIVFVVCALPDLLIRMRLSLEMYAPVVKDYPPMWTMHYVLVASNLFLTINSCANFVIYCFMGRKFRTILMRMLLRRGGSSHRQVMFRELLEKRRKSSVMDDSIVLFQQHHRRDRFECGGGGGLNAVGGGGRVRETTPFTTDTSPSRALADLETRSD